MSPAELQAYSNGYQRKINAEAWLFGQYTQAAFASVLSALFAKNGNPTAEYPAKPYNLFPKNATPQETQDHEEAERLKARLYMHQMMWSCRNLGNKK